MPSESRRDHCHVIRQDVRTSLVLCHVDENFSFVEHVPKLSGRLWHRFPRICASLHADRERSERCAIEADLKFFEREGLNTDVELQPLRHVVVALSIGNHANFQSLRL